MGNLLVALDKDSADYRRLDYNDLWLDVREFVAPIFGPLVVYSAGQVRSDKYLRSCYVKDFADHSDEARILPRLQEMISSTGFSLYSEFTAWIRRKQPYVHGILGHYDDFQLIDRSGTAKPRLLCGRKGSGKTTLLLFATQDIEDATNLVRLCINLDSPCFATPDPLQMLATDIINAMDRSVMTQSQEHGITDDERILACFKRYWKLNACYPDDADTPDESVRKQRDRSEFLRILATQKYTHEFDNYLLSCIAFLQERCNATVIIIIDDVDRLDTMAVARAVCVRATRLCAHLHIPVVVSVREETLAKLADVPGVIKTHVIPPSFRKALAKRRAVFQEHFAMSEHALREGTYTTETSRTFVTHIVDSVLHDDIYVRLVAFHYDLDILFDVVRCLIASPYLTPDYVLSMEKRGEFIPWHMVLNSMQLYIYANFYEQNSFLLNMYHNDAPVDATLTTDNNLVRIRTLQALRHLYPGLDKNIAIGTVYALLGKLGYSEETVFSALRAFAAHRLIVTSRQRNELDSDVHLISTEQTVVFYLDYLIYTYRYLQNALPVTPVDFSLPLDLVHRDLPLSGDKLRETDALLAKFVAFIREAERREKARIRDRSLFHEITRSEVLSDMIEKTVARERSQMMSGESGRPRAR